MTISRDSWENAWEEISAERTRATDKLISGACVDFLQYKETVGFLRGLKFFEDRLKEAKTGKRTTKEEEDAAD